MKKSLAALALAFILPAGLAMAEPQNVIPAPQQVASQQIATQPAQAQSTEQSSFQAF